MQSRIDQILKILKNKNYPITDLGFRGIGGVKKYPYPNLERFVIYGSNSGEWVTYAGAVLNSDATEGENILSQDGVVDMPSDGRVNINGYSLFADRLTPISAVLNDYLTTDFISGTHVLLDGYSIITQGTYHVGDRQLVVETSLPVMPGDQWAIPSQFGVLQTTVISANKTSNPDQWDVIIEDKLDTELPTRSKIMVQASSAVHYSKIPLEMPCWLCLPITTHLQSCSTVFASYVQLKNGEQIVKTIFSPSNVLEIPNVGIPSRCWDSARISQGQVTYQAGLASFVPISGKFSASLPLSSGFDGAEIGKWRFNISTEFSGFLTITVGSRSETFELSPGIQTVSFDVPSERVYEIELISNVPFSLAEILPEKPISYASVSLMVFTQNHLGSHVIASPVVMDMLLDPSLTWMKVGSCRANAGYKPNPQYLPAKYKTPSESLLIDLRGSWYNTGSPLKQELGVGVYYNDGSVESIPLTPIFTEEVCPVRYSCKLGKVDQKGIYYPASTSGVDVIHCEKISNPDNYVEKPFINIVDQAPPFTIIVNPSREALYWEEGGTQVGEAVLYVTIIRNNGYDGAVDIRSNIFTATPNFDGTVANINFSDLQNNTVLDVEDHFEIKFRTTDSGWDEVSANWVNAVLHGLNTDLGDTILADSNVFNVFAIGSGPYLNISVWPDLIYYTPSSPPQDNIFNVAISKFNGFSGPVTAYLPNVIPTHNTAGEGEDYDISFHLDTTSGVVNVKGITEANAPDNFLINVVQGSNAIGPITSGQMHLFAFGSDGTWYSSNFFGMTEFTPPPVAADYMVISGNNRLGVYDSNGAVKVDFNHSGDAIAIEDGDFSTATVLYQNGFCAVGDSVYFTDQPDGGDVTTGDTHIRRIDFTSPTTGTITTIPATAPTDKIMEYGNNLLECGITVIDNYIYTVDAYYQCIWKTPIAGGQRVLFCGGFSNPRGITGLNLGGGSFRLYVVDQAFSGVLSVNEFGVKSTLITDDPGLYRPLAITNDGNYVYVSTNNISGEYGVAKISINGNNIAYIVPQSSDPKPYPDFQSVNYLNNKIYWTDNNSGNYGINTYSSVDGASAGRISLTTPDNGAARYVPRNIVLITI